MAFQIGDKYYIEDIESGEITQISKATFDAMNSWRSKIEAMINPDRKVKGTIIITSTMADNDGGDFKELWDEIPPKPVS